MSVQTLLLLTVNQNTNVDISNHVIQVSHTNMYCKTYYN